MNKTLIFLIIFFTQYNFAQKNIDWKKVEICLQKKQKHCDTSTLKLFVKVDKAIWKIRNKNIQSRLLITNDVEEFQIYDTIMSVSPSFYKETLKHKQTLINLLQKNQVIHSIHDPDVLLDKLSKLSNEIQIFTHIESAKFYEYDFCF